MQTQNQFCSSTIPLQDRVQAIEDTVGTTLTQMRIVAASKNTLSAQITTTPLASLSLASFDLGPITFIRSAQHLKDHDDGFSFVNCLSGSCEILTTEGDRIPIIAGMSALISHNASSITETKAALSTKTLVIPRDTLTKVLRAPEQLTGAVPEGGMVALNLLANYIYGLTQQKTAMTADLQHLVEGQLLDLIANAYDPKGEWSQSSVHQGVQTARLAQLLDKIARSYANPEVSAQTIGVQIGISTRMVHHLLEQTGQTFSQHITERRLQAAMRILQNSRFAHLKILDIALEVGFSDSSYFNRCFKRRFGDRPSAFRYD